MGPLSLNFVARDALSADSDIDFIVSAWDSALPFLESIGAGEMWGSTPFSQREGFTEDIANTIRNAQADPLDDARRILLAEYHPHEADEAPPRLAGAVMIRDALPTYLLKNEDVKAEVDNARSLLHIEALITDRRAPQTCRGSGAALVAAVVERARRTGKKAVYVDAWAGNNRRLNR